MKADYFKISSYFRFDLTTHSSSHDLGSRHLIEFDNDLLFLKNLLNGIWTSDPGDVSVNAKQFLDTL